MGSCASECLYEQVDIKHVHVFIFSLNRLKKYLNIYGYHEKSDELMYTSPFATNFYTRCYGVYHTTTWREHEIIYNPPSFNILIGIDRLSQEKVYLTLDQVQFLKNLPCKNDKVHEMRKFFRDPHTSIPEEAKQIMLKSLEFPSSEGETTLEIKIKRK
jgi:hypothetical protein